MCSLNASIKVFDPMHWVFRPKMCGKKNFKRGSLREYTKDLNKLREPAQHCKKAKKSSAAAESARRMFCTSDTYKNTKFYIHKGLQQAVAGPQLVLQAPAIERLDRQYV